MGKKVWRVWLSLVIIVLLAIAAQGEGGANESFYFAQISDTHLGAPGSLQATEKIVAAINSGKPFKVNFVIHTGDIVNDSWINPDASTGMAAIKKLNVPVYFIPGNHDLSGVPAKVKRYQEKAGALNYTMEYNGVEFIFLFTEDLRENYEIKGYDPLQWLSETLRAAGDKPVIIVNHSPFGHDIYPADIENKIKNLIASYNVKALINGHFHDDSFTWIGEVPVYTSSSIANFWGRQPSYRIYEYKKGKISYETFYLEN